MHIQLTVLVLLGTCQTPQAEANTVSSFAQLYLNKTQAGCVMP